MPHLVGMENPPAKRWYKRKSDGQLGYMTEVNGREMIRLDRPNDPTAVVPYSEDWDPVSSDRPISKHQVAKIAFAADRALCLVLAKHAEAKEEWVGLTDAKRLKFVKEGPPADPPLRRELYEAIVARFPNQTA